MSLAEKFEAAAEEVKQTPSPLRDLSNDEKLTLYKFFKQAKEGDNTTAKPGMLDFTGKAKWTAWDELKGMSKEDAMQKYLDAVDSFRK